MYAMSGLSFREYLELQTGEAFPVWPLERVLAEHERLSLEINRRIRPLAHFGDYLKYGYFPYFRESVETYHRKLEQTLALRYRRRARAGAAGAIVDVRVFVLNTGLRIRARRWPILPPPTPARVRTRGHCW